MVQKEILSIVVEYIKALKNSGIHFEKVILFGSSVKGAAHEWSDIDLAVISPDFGKDRFEERVNLARIAYTVDARLEVHPINSREYENESWRTMIHEIKTTGKTVCHTREGGYLYATQNTG
jgi:predicted nucleotidyltransferase